ncbi:hypothetical protein JB92DRAFT_2884795 [Gautieria morchelliformis]|nr:hypothetical protein JB92DRAFT_2884795 [Gautieria morchelliformis]
MSAWFSHRSANIRRNVLPISASMATALVPTLDKDAMQYAMGTLQLRKRHNRKRSSTTGELIWDDRADVALTLGLIIWTTKPSHRIGIRRSTFLQQFLRTCDVSKTGKQISSRLQVLKNEWNDTPCT